MKKYSDLKFLNRGIHHLIEDTVPDKVLFLVRLQKDWTNIVGKAIAGHSFPAAIRNNILTVHVDDSIWIQELSLRRDEIKSGIFKHFSFQKYQNTFETIKFKNGEINREKAEKEELESYIIDPNILRRIDETVKNVEDKELKESLRRYLIKSTMIPES